MAVAHHDDGLHEQQLTVHRIEDTMKLDGEIDASNLDVLVSALRRMTRTAAGRTVRVDLTRASFLSVGAAEALARHTAAYRDHGGHLELLGVTPQLTRTLQLLQLHPLGQRLCPAADRPEPYPESARRTPVAPLKHGRYR